MKKVLDFRPNKTDLNLINRQIKENAKEIQIFKLAKGKGDNVDYGYLNKILRERYKYLHIFLHGVNLYGKLSQKREHTENDNELKKLELLKRFDSELKQETQNHGSTSIDLVKLYEESKFDSQHELNNYFNKSFTDYQKQHLKLLIGMYCFIDPRSDANQKAKPHYLLGPMTNEEITPSFTFKHFINIKNTRGKEEFTPYPDEWLAFYYKLNAQFRTEIPFRDDYPSLFSDVLNNFKRNEIEKKHNFTYVSSAEIDHGILQWIIILQKDNNKKGNKSFDILTEDISFSIKTIDEQLVDFLSNDDDEYGEIKEKIFDKNSSRLKKDTTTDKAKLKEWLTSFGLIKENGLPTERLLASIELFYYHLEQVIDFNENNVNKIENYKTKHYYSKKNNNAGRFYRKAGRDIPVIKNFMSFCRKVTPVDRSYKKIREPLVKDVAKYHQNLQNLIVLYLKVLLYFAENEKDKPEDFANRCRFSVKSYFFQRYVIGIYDRFLLEKTCRGLVIFPILSNSHNETKKEIPYLGFFMGLIKDSDDKGRCYFNWRVHSDDRTESKTVDYFYNEYLFYLQNFAFSLGRIEVQNIYYRGILNKHINEIKRESTKSTISNVLLRNNAHNLGSHVSYRSTNTQIKKRARELEKAELKEPNQSDIGKIDKIHLPEFAEWLDFFSDKLDKYEIHRNEYLSDLNLSPKTAKFYADIILPFCENTFLMDNIAAGEQLNYEVKDSEKDSSKKLTRNKLSIECRINGQKMSAVYPNLKPMFGEETEVLYPNQFPYLLARKKRKENKETEEKETEKKYAKTFADAVNNKKISEGDTEVSIHSEQAIYSILENFIRNSAKHGNKTEELSVKLDLYEHETHYDLYIYDNLRTVGTPEKLKSIFYKIQENLVDEQGKPKRENWGLADMKINSFLLFNDFEMIENNKLTDNFKLVLVDMKKSEVETSNFTVIEEEKNLDNLDKNEKYQFGFKIKLSTPKQILWIGEISHDIKKNLASQGLEVVASLNSEKLKEAAQKRVGLSSFQFAVINEKTIDYEQYLQVQESLPSRVIVLNGDERLKVKQSQKIKPSILKAKGDIPEDYFQDISKLLKWCWETWLSRTNKNIDLYLYFENSEVAEKWSDEYNLGNGINVRIVNHLKAHSLSNNNTKNIIYDHHGNAFRVERNGENCLIATSASKMNFGKDHSVVCFGGGSEDFSSFNYPPAKAKDKEQILYQRIDAATTNIFIVDERISEIASNKFTNDFQVIGEDFGSVEIQKSNWSVYAAGKIFVIHEIINDGIESCSIGQKKKKESKLALDITGNNIKLITEIPNLENIDEIDKDIIVIHRTYLDKNRTGIEPQVFLDRLSRTFGSVFITSGGGYPHNLQDKWRFISFSVLESCVNAQPAKNKLNNILRTNIK